MGLELLTTPFPWSRYSRKLAAKIEKPHNVGTFDKNESEQRGMRLVIGIEGEVRDGNCVQFSWLVDKEDGSIVDAKFQVYGQSALIGAAEVACELLVGKNYDQAKRIGVDLIDKQVRDRTDEPAFPQETAPHLNLVLDAIDHAADQCMDIPLPTAYVAPPAPHQVGEVLEGGYPGWDTMAPNKRLAVIEQVLNDEIRPYIALDGGGVEVKELKDNELVISYQGNCTSCFSAVGATLSYIQQTIKARVHPDLRVVPDLNLPA
jgi:NifU-like protein